MLNSRKLKSIQSVKLRNLLLAILLLLLSVLAVNTIIAVNNNTDEFLVAGKDIPAGSPITNADAVIGNASLGASAINYIQSGDLPPGSYLLAPIRSGQLIPKSLLATEVIDQRVPLVVNSAMGLASGLVAGSSVDLWVTPIFKDKTAEGKTSVNKTSGEPYVLVLGAEVAKLMKSDGMFSDENPEVELWVPVDAIAPVLAAMSSGEKISLVLRPTLADG